MTILDIRQRRLISDDILQYHQFSHIHWACCCKEWKLERGGPICLVIIFDIRQRRLISEDMLACNQFSHIYWAFCKEWKVEREDKSVLRQSSMSVNEGSSPRTWFGHVLCLWCAGVKGKWLGRIKVISARFSCCFEPSQPQGIISGLKTHFNFSPSHFPFMKKNPQAFFFF